MYGYYGYNSRDVFSALGIGVFPVILIWLLAYVAANFVSRWNMFIKAGEAGWKCLIPIYSDYTEWKIAGFGKEYIQLLLVGIGLGIASLLFMLLGVFGIIVSAVAWIVYITLTVVVTIRKCMRLAKAFGQSDTFGLLGLFVFPGVGNLILSWGNCTYQAPPVPVDEFGTPVNTRGSMLTGIFTAIKEGRPVNL